MSIELSGKSRLRDLGSKPRALPSSTFWVVSELYYPQETATGYLLTQLAEGLAKGRTPGCDLQEEIGVICAMPLHLPHGSEPPADEVCAGVHIHRCRATALNKDNLLLRLANAATQTLSLAWAALRRVQRGDAVLVVTNPPTLPFLVALICALKHAPCILLIHDLYPDAAVAAGVLKDGCWAVQIIRRCHRTLYHHVERIVVLGRDMQERVRALVPDQPQRVVVIPNWAEPDAIQPCARDETQLVRELKLEGKFIVEYAGNMARVNDVETLLRCAEQLRDRSEIHFLLLGAGAKRRWIEEQVTARGLTNVSLIASRPRREQADFLNACDVGVVALCRGMYGVSVPSRTYNIMAAGRPVLAIVEQGSEIARMVEEEGAGWVIPPGDAEQLAQKIQTLTSDRQSLSHARQRARHAAETTYSLQSVLYSYQELIHCLHVPSI
ncbi:MAG: glycosyltransferase family 4 protein [Caldilineaceae bacterium]